MPRTLNHRENCQTEGQLAQNRTRQIQDSSNNLVSRSLKENDDKATKDNDSKVTARPMVVEYNQAKEPNLYNRRVDEEDL